MKLIHLIETRYNDPGTLRIGQYDEEYAGTFTMWVEQLMKKRVKPEVKSLKPSQVFATQDWIDDHGGGDPVFPQFHQPVLVFYEGEYYILDGHHRFHRAAKTDSPVASYVFNVNQR